MKRIPLCLTLACLYSMAAVGSAADSKATTDVVSVSGPLRDVEPRSINVDFPGGPVNKLIAAVAKADPVSFTIIFNSVNPEESAEFAKVELPAFSLRNLTLIGVAEVIGNLLEQRGFSVRPVAGPNSVVCMIRKIATNEKPNAPQIQFLSFQLAPYLQTQSVDDIVSALHSAWELDPSHSAEILRVKFHPGTSILLISGPQESINIARNVLLELKRAPEQKALTPAPESRQDKK